MKRYLIALVVLFVANSAAAQAPNAGFPKYGSFESGSSDSVNRQNLNSNFSIPIIHQKARGLNLDFAISYNSLIWQNTGTAWQPYADANGNPTWGWNQTNPFGYVYQTVVVTQSCIYTYSNVSYVEPNGTSHPFSISYTTKVSPCGSGTTGTTTGYATDDSGYYINAVVDDGPLVIAPDGTRALLGNFPQIKDTNGNYVSGTPGSEWDWTDSVGRTALKIIGSAPNPVQYEYQDSTGTYQKFTLTFQNFNVKTNFACGTISEYSGTANLPVSLSMPNGQAYSFNYEGTPGYTGYVTGRISQVTLPNGGHIQYQYGTQNDGIECVNGTSDGTIVSMIRIVNDGSTSNTWQFARAQNGSNWVTTETKPQMPYDSAPNQAVHTFNSNGQETSAQIYQGSSSGGTLLRTISTTWATNGSPATRITTLDNNQKSEVATTYDNYGNLDQMQEYDFGNAPGPLLRTTTYSYLSTSQYTNANILNRVTLKTIADSTGTIHYRESTSYDGTALSPCPTGVPQHDDANYGCSFSTRGNPTSFTVYTNAAAPSGPITKNRSYDVFGNLVQADLDCCQSKKWNFSSGTQYADPDSVVSGAAGGPQVTTSYTYNSYTEQVATTTDPNNQTTSSSYDLMRRPTTTTRPDNAQIANSYDDIQHTATLTTPVQGSNVKKNTRSQDGLNRTVNTAISDGSGTVYSNVQKVYDPLAQLYELSNPSTGSGQYWKDRCLDGLMRPAKVIFQDGTYTTYAYTGPYVTTTDSTGKQREYQYDGLNRLIDVFEPDPTNNNSLTLQTAYVYTVLDKITSVTQGAQTRTFNYDDAGRLASETTPEGGTTGFQYNNFDKITQRTDARGVITTYNYDTLNRLYQISYNVGTTGVAATPTVTYTYGTDTTKYNNGRLLTVTDGAGSETYSYDLLGRTTQIQEVINGNTYTIGYQYNLAGEVTTLTYPSTRAVTFGYDAIGRVSSIVSGTTTFANGIGYNAANQITGFNYGNGIAATRGYAADTMQLNSISYAKGGTTLLSENYSYAQNGGNDGEITTITDNVDSGRSLTLGYDALKRLTSSVSQGSTNYPKWGLSFAYDRYGNRTAETVTAGTGPSNSVTVNPATNQITSGLYLYDANGNVIADYFNRIAYDAENRIVADRGGFGAGTYTYQASGHRVVKVSGSNTTVYIFNGDKVIAEYVNGALSKEYIYLGNQQLAGYLYGTLSYYLPDRLSNRAVTDTNGSAVGQQGNYPFGESWYGSGTTTEWQFTSYERDAESGNDYAIAREYVSRVARFSATDTGQITSTDPQGFNRYAYVANDPVNRVDPSGSFFDPIGECDPDFDFGCGGSCDPFFDPFCGLGGGGDLGGDGGGGDGGGGGTLPPPVPFAACTCFLGAVDFSYQFFGCGPYLCACDDGEIGFLLIPPKISLRCFFSPCPFSVTVIKPGGVGISPANITAAFPPLCK